jgi:predicted TIM-barrel fold metal-dependent hydrolase
LSSLLQLVSVSQVMYGTDFPFRGCVENVEGLKDCGFSEADMQAIERDNALRIMPQLKL